MAKATEPKTRSILVELLGGEQQIIEGVPENAKITFGPVTPGKGSYDRSNALRIYTTQSNQLAVFVGVQSFRDLSLTVKKRVTKSAEAIEQESGPNGKKVSRDSVVEYEWETA